MIFFSCHTLVVVVPLWVFFMAGCLRSTPRRVFHVTQLSIRWEKNETWIQLPNSQVAWYTVIGWFLAFLSQTFCFFLGGEIFIQQKKPLGKKMKVKGSRKGEARINPMGVLNPNEPPKSPRLETRKTNECVSQFSEKLIQAQKNIRKKRDRFPIWPPWKLFKGRNGQLVVFFFFFSGGGSGGSPKVQELKVYHHSSSSKCQHYTQQRGGWSDLFCWRICLNIASSY